MSPSTEREQLRLVTRVAWLYHVRGLKQSEVADALGLSQSRVSRLLDSATTLGIVRTTVRVPPGLQFELEQGLQERYGVREAHVLDLPDDADDSGLLRDLGQVLAGYLLENPLQGQVIGLTSWSRTLREAVHNLEPAAATSASYVVELLGDVGPPEVQHQAAEVTQLLARLTGAQPRFLRVPGVVTSPVMRDTLLEHDGHARETLALLNEVDEALVGIGTCSVDPPLREGDNFFTAKQLRLAQKLGAVGQVNMRFIDAEGQPVSSELDELVIGLTLDQLRACKRVIAVAGGPRKYAAVRAALLGGLISGIVTDVATARVLLKD